MIGELAALGAAICWAVSAVLYRRALLVTKPISANTVRCICTSLILVVGLLVLGKSQILTSLPAYAIVLASLSGIIGLGIGDTLYMVSLKLIGVVRAVPITCTYPLFNLIFAVLLQGETVTLQVVFGAATIVFGIWLLTYEEGRGEGGSQKRIIIKGVVLAVATAIVWSVSIAMANIAVTLPETSSLDGAFAINTIRVSAVAAFLLAFSPVTDRQFRFLRIEKKMLLVLLFGGIVALALGWFFLTFSFLQIPEAQAVPISSTSPLFATVSGVMFLHERVRLRNVVGSVLIVIGIFLIFMV